MAILCGAAKNSLRGTMVLKNFGRKAPLKVISKTNLRNIRKSKKGHIFVTFLK
jgi:hypothetical protein